VGELLRQNAKKARKIKGLYEGNMRNTVSKQLVAHLSSASDNRLLRLYQKVYKTPENQGFPGFSYTQTGDKSLTSFDQTRAIFPQFLVVKYRTTGKNGVKKWP